MPNTLKAIAVDDELHCLETLLWELKRNCPEVEVIGQYQDAEQAYEVLKKADIDILFLDINLQSTSGIELLNRLMPVDYHVVFVTAYDEYAIQAFDLAATHYLLKPVNGKKLKSAIDRIKDAYASVIDQDAIEKLMESIRFEMGSVRKVPFSVQSGIEFISPDDIIYIEGENNYSILHLSGNKKLVVSKTLGHTEEVLNGYSFIRIHKSYLINLKYIKRYVKTDGGYVELENGVKLSVSRMRKLALNDLFKS
jgi:two-component system LytT family response regulator